MYQGISGKEDSESRPFWLQLCKLDVKLSQGACGALSSTSRSHPSDVLCNSLAQFPVVSTPPKDVTRGYGGRNSLVGKSQYIHGPRMMYSSVPYEDSEHDT